MELDHDSLRYNTNVGLTILGNTSFKIFDHIPASQRYAPPLDKGSQTEEVGSVTWSRSIGGHGRALLAVLTRFSPPMISVFTLTRVIQPKFT